MIPSKVCGRCYEMVDELTGDGLCKRCRDRRHPAFDLQDDEVYESFLRDTPNITAGETSD